MKKMILFGAMLACLLGLCGCGNSALEDSAVPLVTSIIKDQLGGSASCVSVDITEKVSDTRFLAKAKLDNGNTLVIVIEKSGDQILVTIPNQ